MAVLFQSLDLMQQLQWGLILAAYQYNIVFKHTSQHGNATAMSQLQLYTSLKESPIPTETDLSDPVQGHMRLIIIDAHSKKHLG